MDSCVCTAVAREGTARQHRLVAPSYASAPRSANDGAFDDIANFYACTNGCRATRSLSRDWRISAHRQEHFVPENDWVARPAWQRDSVTYVPFRNAHFLSVAVSWAEAIGAGAI